MAKENPKTTHVETLDTGAYILGRELGPEEEKFADLHSAVLNGVEKLCEAVYTDWTGREPTEDIFAIPFNSGEVHGYLIIKSSGVTKPEREKFFALLTTALNEHILDKTQIKIDEGIDVNIPILNFKSWVNTMAAFKVSSEYEETKFCIAFIPTKKPLPELLPIQNKNMLKIPTEEISSSFPVTFKGYLELKKNDRFFLYLKNGRRLLPEQKQRLINKNIKDLCVKQIDLSNLRRFLIATHLADSIQETLE